MIKTIEWTDEGVRMIDQTKLPFEFAVAGLKTLDDAATAIRDMWVRGAPLIGATAAYGMALAVKDDASDAGLENAYAVLYATRPTAVNLRWALDDLRALLAPLPTEQRRDAAYARAGEICDADVDMCSSLGEHGRGVIEDIWVSKGNRRALSATSPTSLITLSLAAGNEMPAKASPLRGNWLSKTVGVSDIESKNGWSPGK